MNNWPTEKLANETAKLIIAFGTMDFEQNCPPSKLGPAKLAFIKTGLHQNWPPSKLDFSRACLQQSWLQLNSPQAKLPSNKTGLQKDLPSVSNRKWLQIKVTSITNHPLWWWPVLHVASYSISQYHKIRLVS